MSSNNNSIIDTPVQLASRLTLEAALSGLPVQGTGLQIMYIEGRTTIIFSTKSKLIDMSYRNLTEDSLRKIHEQLPGHTDFEIVKMHENNLDNRAGIMINKLFFDKFLGAVQVDLSNNKFSSGFVENIIGLMSKCKKLKRLDLSGNNLSLDDKKRIKEASQKYPDLGLFLGPKTTAEELRD